MSPSVPTEACSSPTRGTTAFAASTPRASCPPRPAPAPSASRATAAPRRRRRSPDLPVWNVTADGSLYIADLGNLRIRRVSPDGIIETVAGNGSGASSTGNEGPATAASLASAARVRVGPDGSFYVAETAGNVVRRVGPDGVIRAFAGGGGSASNTLVNSSMVLQAPSEIAVGPDGSVFVSDQSQTVRRIDARGIVTTVAGVAGVSTFAGDNGAAAAATMGTTLGLRVAPDGTVYLAGTADNRVRRVAAALPGFTSPSGSISIPSPGWVGAGLRLRRDRPPPPDRRCFHRSHALRVLLRRDRAAHLGHRRQRRRHAVDHDAAGNLTSIVSPFGVTTRVTPDANGYLASATDPTNATTTFIYGGSGLLQSKTDARGGVSTYTFDSQGRLTKDQDAAGNAKTLSESDALNSGLVTLKTPSGVQTQLTTTMNMEGALLRDDHMLGFEEQFRRTAGASTTSIALDSTKTVTTDTPDPRFGMLAPVHTVTTTTPAASSPPPPRPHAPSRPPAAAWRRSSSRRTSTATSGSACSTRPPARGPRPVPRDGRQP